jgi:hypothetical protein
VSSAFRTETLATRQILAIRTKGDGSGEISVVERENGVRHTEDCLLVHNVSARIVSESLAIVMVWVYDSESGMKFYEFPVDCNTGLPIGVTMCDQPYQHMKTTISLPTIKLKTGPLKLKLLPDVVSQTLGSRMPDFIYASPLMGGKSTVGLANSDGYNTKIVFVV